MQLKSCVGSSLAVLSPRLCSAVVFLAFVGRRLQNALESSFVSLPETPRILQLFFWGFTFQFIHFMAQTSPLHSRVFLVKCFHITHPEVFIHPPVFTACFNQGACKPSCCLRTGTELSVLDHVWLIRGGQDVSLLYLSVYNFSKVGVKDKVKLRIKQVFL